jgi:hypothetical protein
VIASEPKSEREPTPIGALFEAAFRRYGARITSYTLYSIAFALIPGLLVVAVRPSASRPIGLVTVCVLVGAMALSHLLLAGTLTALVTGTLRSRLWHIVAAAAIGAVVIGLGWAVAGPLVALLYPPLVFAPIAAAAGDASALAAPLHGARLAFRDWGRSYGVWFGLAVCLVFLWFAFQVSLTPINGDARGVAVLSLTTLIMSPLAALVERNLYGDITGRTVLPPSVSLLQEERGKRPKRPRRGGSS